jgi:hypothetical protein
MRIAVLAALALLASPAAGAVPDDPSPPPDRAAAEAALAQMLAQECAKVTCRKGVRQVSLRMKDGSSFDIATRPLPYIDDKGTLVLFAGESVTLSFPDDDTKLEHPALSAVKDPLGPVDLPPPAASAQSLGFSFGQLDGKPDMALGVTNLTKATVKYDVLMFIPDAAAGNARAAKTTACSVPPPPDNKPTFGLEHWPQPLVMLVITNIRAQDPGTPRSCD